MPTITSETTYGTKISTRMTERPAHLLVQQQGQADGDRPWMIRDSTTMKPLCSSASWNAVSLRMIR